MNADRVAELREAYGGTISQEKVEYLLLVKMFLAEALERGVPFPKIVRLVADDIRSILRNDFTLPPSLNIYEYERHPDFVGALRTGKQSEEEKAFLRDTIAFLEFGLRNGFTFHAALESLGHDFLQIQRLDYSFEKLKEDCFRPKVTGYYKFNQEPPVDPETDWEYE